jgi:hypothetical protein
MMLWAPLLQGDNKYTAQAATKYVPDSRARHYWDLWSYGQNTYSKQLGTPHAESWDLFALYKPYLVWKESLPEPTRWFQRRNLEVGEVYTQEKLEAAMAEYFK